MPKKSTAAPANGSTSKPAQKKAMVKAEQPKVIEPIADQLTIKVEETPVRQEFQVLEVLDPHSYVTVRNGFNGRLVYVSKRSGERLVWSEFGDEQDMELQELKNAKNSYRAFFENNWFMIDDPAVIAYLGVERYYKNALAFEHFDDLFNLSPTEIERRVALLSEGQKASVAYRARQLIAEKEIDSIRVIEALERSLSTELIQH